MASYRPRLKRRCRRKEEIGLQSTTLRKTSEFHANDTSFTRRWTVFYTAVGMVLITLICILIIKHQDIPAKKLVPPNPEVRQPPSPSKLHTFWKAAVCSDGPPCSQIGQSILKQGGTAVDAAIATLFCNGVVNSHSMGLGGGFFMVVYNHKKGKAESLNAREKAPFAAHKDMFTVLNGQGSWEMNSQPSRTGGLAIGVPGELRGYWEAWKKYGRIEWPKLVRPAMYMCRNGYNLSKHQFDMLGFRGKTIYDDPNLRETFVDPETNKYYLPGTLIKPAKLCDTLERISIDGGDVLNNGALTSTLLEDLKELGSIITEEDLHRYRPEWTDPVSVTLHSGETIYSVPPPGSGAVLTHILSILDGYNITKPIYSETFSNEILTIHRMIEAFKFSFARRTEMGDPHFVNITELIGKLTSKKYGDEVRRKIKDDTTYDDPNHYGAVYYTSDSHGTAHVSVISGEGDAVSATSTINLYFGAGVTSKGTGVILNSVMDDFSIPDQINYFDLPPSPNNFIAPGKRPLSSAAPAIVVDSDGSVRLALGASGGTKIPTAIAWVIIRHLWFGEDIKQAIDTSRIHHQLLPMEISYEYGVLDQIIKGLEDIGHKTNRYRDRGSIVCAIARKNGLIYANADFRKSGDVSGLN